MKGITKIGFCLLSFLGLVACENDKNFPITPVLESRSFVKTSNFNAIWTIGFTDGDGDIGVRNNNDSDNFFVTIFSIEADTIIEIPGRSFRIPVVQNIRTTKGIEGSFEFRIETDLLLPIDSVQYSGYAVDRAGNESNVVFTPIFSTSTR
tara:strand:- start:758 stop:1207 length:450 start_codon:yes stop_codon:yes gene_type:complete